MKIILIPPSNFKDHKYISMHFHQSMIMGFEGNIWSDTTDVKVLFLELGIFI